MRFVRVLAVAAVTLAALPAAAQNWGFLGRGPADQMNKHDIALMMKNFNEALDGTPDGHTSAWINPATGASGTVTPLSTGTDKGMTCRRFEMTNSAGGMSGRSEFRACKTKAGWKIAS